MTNFRKLFFNDYLVSEFSTTQKQTSNMRELIIIAVAAMVVLSSCSKDDSNELEPTPPENSGSPTTGYAEADHWDVMWVQLWEGGPKFAEYNVGAEWQGWHGRKAGREGNYYTWGGYDNVVGNTNPSYNTSSVALDGNSDTATKLWGDNWRMPTEKEFQALLDNCDVEIVKRRSPSILFDVYGANGWKFTGRGEYSSNSIFLPAAGFCYKGVIRDAGNICYYWSSTNCCSFPIVLILPCYDQDNRPLINTNYSNYGFSVRPVLKE